MTTPRLGSLIDTHPDSIHRHYAEGLPALAAEDGGARMTEAMQALETAQLGTAPTLAASSTKTTGTNTLSRANGLFQQFVNGGAHTLAPQTTDGLITFTYTNNASAGAITTSGYDDVVGSFGTTNGDKYLCRSYVFGSLQILEIVALQ